MFVQVSGFTVVADKLNVLRYMSHFRCVHRGAYFSQMKTTSVRKLLPEAWGALILHIVMLWPHATLHVQAFFVPCTRRTAHHAGC